MKVLISGVIAVLFLKIAAWLIFTISSSEIWEEEQSYTMDVHCPPPSVARQLRLEMKRGLKTYDGERGKQLTLTPLLPEENPPRLLVKRRHNESAD